MRKMNCSLVFNPMGSALLILLALVILPIAAPAASPDSNPSPSQTAPSSSASEGDDAPPDPRDSLAPYVPTPQAVVEEMLKMARVTKNDVVYDLGCGDGRIVIMAAKQYGARGVGVDFNPDRVREARINAKQHGVEDRVRILRGDAMKVPLTSATVVALYLLPLSNEKLRPRLEQLLPVGARVVSHDFGMAAWKPIEMKTITDRRGRNHKVYLWRITPEMKAGASPAR